MLKYLAAIMLVFGLSIYVSNEYKKHAENPAGHFQQPIDKPFSLSANKQPETQIGQPGWNPPRWYRLFSWPDGIGVWGLFLTLCAIAEQTNQTRRAAEAGVRAAEAANRSVATFIAAQEPQIWVTVHGNPKRDVFGKDIARVQLEMSNKGPTTAENLSHESWIEVLPFGVEEFTALACYWKCAPAMPLYASQEPVIINIPLDRAFDESEKADIRALRKKVCVRVKVTYRDIFSTNIHYVNFGFVVQQDGLGFMAKYNDRGTETNNQGKQNVN